MLGLRLIFGTLLALLALLVLGVDAWLAWRGAAVGWGAGRGSTGLGEWVSGGGPSTGLALLFVSMTAGELVRLARTRGYQPCGTLAQVFSAGLVLGPYMTHHAPQLSAELAGAGTMIWLALATGLSFAAQAARHRAHLALANIGTTLLIVLYAGGLGAFLTKLRMDVGGTEGVVVLVLTIFTVKMSDTGAYFVGRALGRRRLIEWLSPRKTWEGFLGGLAAAMLFALVAGTGLESAGALGLRRDGLGHPWGLLAFGLTIGLVSAAGDLCASLLKRDAEVKESGRILPGLGGWLDVMDSLLLSAPVAWYFWCRLLLARDA